MKPEVTEQTQALAKSLQQAINYNSAAWNQVIEAARVYAQMKTHGTYETANGVIHINRCDKEDYEQRFLESLQHYILTAYAEDAHLGIAVSKAQR